MKTEIQKFFLLVIAAGLAVGHPAFSDQLAQQLQNAFTPMQLPAPQNTDRKQGTDMAKIMAMGAAGLQMALCLKMMQDAQEKDDDTLKMLAMMECNQAAQTAANAAQNKDGENQLQNQPQQTAQAGSFQQTQASPQPQPSDSSNGFILPSPDHSTNIPDPVITDVPTPVPSIPPHFTASADDTHPSAGPSVPSSTIPGSIDRVKLDYDSSGKIGNNDPTTRDLPIGSSYLVGQGANAGNGGNTLAGVDPLVGSGQPDGRKKSEEDSGAAGAGGSSGDGEAKPAGNNPLDAMMALLGGGGAAAAGGGDASGGDIVMIKKDGTSSEPGPNIFEYASFRYQQLSKDEKRVGKSPKKIAGKELTSASLH